MTEQSDEEHITAIEARAEAWTVSDYKYSTATKLAKRDVPWLVERLRATQAEVTEYRQRDIRDSEAGETPYDFIERIGSLTREVAARDTVLTELVTLKDGPRDADYERRKPAAWDAARTVIAGPESFLRARDRCSTCGGTGVVGSPPDAFMSCPDCGGNDSADDRTDDRAGADQ